MDISSNEKLFIQLHRDSMTRMYLKDSVTVMSSENKVYR